MDDAELTLWQENLGQLDVCRKKLTAVEAERDELRRQLKAEQDAAKRLMDRFCKAMGTWESCWDNAVEARLKEKSK